MKKLCALWKGENALSKTLLKVFFISLTVFPYSYLPFVVMWYFTLYRLPFWFSDLLPTLSYGGTWWVEDLYIKWPTYFYILIYPPAVYCLCLVSIARSYLKHQKSVGTMVSLIILLLFLLCGVFLYLCSLNDFI